MMNLKTKYTPEIKKILVPISFGNDGLIALRQAMIFQKIYNCEITLLHVINSTSLLERTVQRYKQTGQINKFEKKLEKFATTFFNGQLPSYIKIKIARGSLISTIISTSRKINSDLIIIKKKKRKISKLSAFKIENADKLISGSHCPVLSISDDINNRGVKNILIPIDITKKIANKIAWGKHLALKFNAKVHVVSVLDIDIAPVSSLAYRKAMEIQRSMDEAGLDSNVVLLKAKKESMHQVINSHIIELNPDLVLLMTHQESILFDNYIGEFATKIIHRSKSPVFSLAPTKETLMVNILDSFNHGKSPAIY